jgi:hypothetical protein
VAIHCFFRTNLDGSLDRLLTSGVLPAFVERLNNVLDPSQTKTSRRKYSRNTQKNIPLKWGQ